MKAIFKFSKSIMALVLTFAVGLSLSLNSCMPGNEPEGGGNSSDKPESKPDPENVQQIGLFNDSGDNLAGLGFTRDGYITTILSSASEWYLSPVGDVPGLGNVDYIPMQNWDTLIFPRVGLGFVGYSASQGFTRFFVAALAYDDNRNIVGVGLKFVGGFVGTTDSLELDEYSYEFSHSGGSAQAKISGNKYATYQLYCNDAWLNVRRASSNYSFISDRIDIEVAPNPTAEQRRAVVTVRTSSGMETRFVVKQSGNPNAVDEE